MFDTSRDQAEGLRRIFHPVAPSLIPFACAAAADDCRRYVAVVHDRFERIGSRPAVIDRIAETDGLREPIDAGRHGRLLLLDRPVRLARWVAGRQTRLLLLLSHQRAALPPQYAMIKAIATDPVAGALRQFGTFFVDAPDAQEAEAAHGRLAECAARFLRVDLQPVNRVSGSLAAMTDGSLARLQDYAIELGPERRSTLPPGPAAEIMH